MIKSLLRKQDIYYVGGDIILMFFFPSNTGCFVGIVESDDLSFHWINYSTAWIARVTAKIQYYFDLSEGSHIEIPVKLK